MKNSIEKLNNATEKIMEALAFEFDKICSKKSIDILKLTKIVDKLSKAANLIEKLEKLVDSKSEGLGMTDEEEKKILNDFLEMYR